ncbi:MAG: 23S rRNA (guanosine(2251)-2'-O)-methyltransferase RlmB [Thermoflexales bacterium]|nr:23S rRNA (guanosine(2251)-2'-O)-methyltransferase RlmB [Thermoflexales bacterium]
MNRRPVPHARPPMGGGGVRIPDGALYGRHAVLECLRAGRRSLTRLWLAEGARDAAILNEIAEAARARKVPIEAVPREALDRISDHAQGVALSCGSYPYVEVDEMLAAAQAAGEPPLLLMLDTLQDPQNLGTLIRAADAVGVHGVILPERRSAGVTPAVVNASSGAVEHLRIAQVVNLAREVDALKKQDVWVAALQDDARATGIFDTNLRGGLALIVGNEGEGVSRLLRDKADYLIRLPMRGRIASLNAASAGSIALYEVLRQRQAAS